MPRSTEALVRSKEPTVLDLTLARPGSIRGLVSDPGADAALEGVEVHLSSATGEPLAVRLTDEEGCFTFESLRPGAYRVVPVAPVGWVLEQGPAEVVIAPRAALELDFTLRPGGVVRGRVVDEDTQEPLSGLAVVLVDSAGRELRRATTGPDGDYEFVNLPEDRYEVKVDDSPPADA